MAEVKDKAKQYYIPDNFIEEGRILSGRIKMRNLIEAIILTIVFAFPALIIVSNLSVSMQTRISILISICSPPAIIGIIGFNGDSVFYMLKCLHKWMSNNQTMLFNHRPKLLRDDPVSASINEPGKLDALLDRYETTLKRHVDKKVNAKYEEGRDFVFEDDMVIDKYTKTKKQKEQDINGKRSKKQTMESSTPTALLRDVDMKDKDISKIDLY